MSQFAERRASYGHTSPIVGKRGARTRERIVAEYLSYAEPEFVG